MGPLVLNATVAVVAAVAGAVALYLILAWLLRIDPRPERATLDQQKLLTDMVKIALGLAAGIGAAVALIVGYRRARVDESASHRDDRRLFSSRYQDAADLLGHEQAAVRLAGIYAMSRLADDWAEQRQQCIDVLCAYLRLPYDPDTSEPRRPPSVKRRHTRVADVRIGARHGEREVRHTVIRLIKEHLQSPARLQIAARQTQIQLEIPPRWHGHLFDFTGAVFDGGDFTDADFSGSTYVNFSGAQFSGGTVTFGGAQFGGGAAIFDGAEFSGGTVKFTGAQFGGGAVYFDGAQFSGGTVTFNNAQFGGADLTYVNFSKATFSGGTVDFNSAGFVGADVEFRGATFSGGTVDFGAATFSGGLVHFDEATFASGTVLFGRNYPGGLGVEFSGGTVDFGGAVFAGATVDFGGATFSGGEVDLSKTTLQPGSAAPQRLPEGPIVGLKLPSWVATTIGDPLPAEDGWSDPQPI